jgi:hypothetical protein
MMDAAIIEELISRFQHEPPRYGVAAQFIGESGRRDLDGVRWRFAVSDGSTVEVIEAVLSGTGGGEAGMEVEPTELEYKVEKRARQYAIETRLRDLVADSPIELEPAE